jgi:hypothetical protein
MSNATVRANAQALPEATSYPNANVRALAAQFDAALQAYHAFFHGGGTDADAAAATDAVKAVAQKIIAVPGTDISIMRLKARVYLWAESTDREKLAAEGGDWPSEAVLASLFRDLGVAGLDATPGPATMADRAPTQHEEARMNAATPVSPESELERRHSRAFKDLEPKIHDLTHMAELARFHAVESFGSNSPEETEEIKRERSIALFAVVHVTDMVSDFGESLRRRLVQQAVSSVARRCGIGSAIASEGAAFGPPFCLPLSNAAPG